MKGKGSKGKYGMGVIRNGARPGIAGLMGESCEDEDDEEEDEDDEEEDEQEDDEEAEDGEGLGSAGRACRMRFSSDNRKADHVSLPGSPSGMCFALNF